MPNELWFIALIDAINDKHKIMTCSISASENKVKEWAKRNRLFLKNKNWIIVKYDLSKWTNHS